MISKHPSDYNQKRHEKQPLSILGRILTVMVILSVFLGLCRMGLWQWHRAEIKEAIALAQSHAGNRLGLTEMEAVTLAPADSEWRDVRWRGHFDAKHSLLWQNRFRKHHLGVEVWTPFYLASGRGMVLVNRGWLEAHSLDKSGLADASVELEGQIVWPQAGFLLGENLSQGDWPKTLQSWSLSTLRQLYGAQLLPFMVRLSKHAPNGFERGWSIGGLSPLRHRLYAYQWWLFAAVWLIGIMIYFRRNEHEIM